MDILTNSVRIKGTSDPAGAIIAALCNFGTPEEPRIPTVDEKRAAIRLVLGELVSQIDWALSPDSPVLPTKKQALSLYRRELKRMDLTNPETVIILDAPTIDLSDFLPVSADAVQDGSFVAAQSIPGWSTWTRTQTESWYTTKIVDPLNAPLPTTVSASTNRQIIIALIDIMKDMGVMIWAIAQMVIALRNRAWPGLQE